MTSWERDYLNDNELFTQVENSLQDFAADMSYVVMWNQEDDNPSNVRNIVPADVGAGDHGDVGFSIWCISVCFSL